MGMLKSIVYLFLAMIPKNVSQILQKQKHYWDGSQQFNYRKDYVKRLMTLKVVLAGVKAKGVMCLLQKVMKKLYVFNKNMYTILTSMFLCLFDFLCGFVLMQNLFE